MKQQFARTRRMLSLEKTQREEEAISYLFDGIRNEDEVTVKAILSEGLVDLNEEFQDEKNPLMLAASMNRCEIAKLLLQAGADADIMNQSKATALCFAAKGGNVDMIRLLAEAGADINNVWGQGAENPLLLGIHDERNTAVRTLIELGANVNIESTWQGFTPLMMGVLSNDAEIVELLIQAGADVTAENDLGRTALAINQRTWNNPEITKLLAEKLYQIIEEVLLEMAAGVIRGQSTQDAFAHACEGYCRKTQAVNISKVCLDHLKAWCDVHGSLMERYGFAPEAIQSGGDLSDKGKIAAALREVALWRPTEP